MLSYLKGKCLYTPVQIRFSDIDIVGHVNNAVYPSFFDLAKMDFLNTIFENTIDWKNEGFVLAHIETDFIEPVYIKDQVEVQSSLVKIGEKSFRIEQNILVRNGEDLELRAKNQSVMVCFQYKTKKSLNITPEQREMLDNYLI